MSKIWMSGSGGADVEPVTAEPPDVVEGKVIVDKDGNPLTGTLVDHDRTTDAVSAAMSNNKILTRIPTGAYRYTTASGYPEVGLPAPTMGAAGGLNAGKMLKGQSAFGINGTATSDANAVPNSMLSGKTAYVNGAKITGAIPFQNAETDGDRVWATNASNWAGTVNVGVRNGHYLNGVNWVRYDMPNYQPWNIKKGVNMGGVVGTHEGFVPQPNDLYYRGNNVAGITISAYNNYPSFQSGGIRVPGGAAINILTPNSYNLDAWNYLNVEIYFETFTGTYGYERDWYGSSAELTAVGTGAKSRGTTAGGDNQNYTISIPLAGLHYTSRISVNVGAGLHYRHQTDDDDYWVWSYEMQWRGWVYRVWLS